MPITALKKNQSLSLSVRRRFLSPMSITGYFKTSLQRLLPTISSSCIVICLTGYSVSILFTSTHSIIHTGQCQIRQEQCIKTTFSSVQYSVPCLLVQSIHSFINVTPVKPTRIKLNNHPNHVLVSVPLSICFSN